jgi:hypothetical protein
LFKSCALLALGLVLALFLFRADMARWVIIWFGAISFGLMFLKEELLLQLFQSNVVSSQYRRRFVLVGTSEETARMRQELRTKAPGAIEVLAELDLNQTPLQGLVDLLHEHSVNGVIINARGSYFDQVESAIRACELEGVEVWLLADFFKTQISRTSFDDFHGRPVLVFSSTPETSWQGVVKQVLDFTLALVMLVALLPLLLLIALLIKITSPGPVLFRQQRSGLNGRPFTIYKFRTMVTNAEQLKHELEAMTR